MKRVELKKAEHTYFYVVYLVVRQLNETIGAHGEFNLQSIHIELAWHIKCSLASNYVPVAGDWILSLVVDLNRVKLDHELAFRLASPVHPPGRVDHRVAEAQVCLRQLRKDGPGPAGERQQLHIVCGVCIRRSCVRLKPVALGLHDLVPDEVVAGLVDFAASVEVGGEHEGKISSRKRAGSASKGE